MAKKELTPNLISKKAVKGVLALTGRTIFLRAFSFLTQGFLWAFLEPGDFGVFMVVAASVNFLSYFADIGLGAALIQKKEKPDKEDYTTVFTVQQLLVVFISLLLVFLVPFFGRIHSLGYEGRLLFYSLVLSFFLASLKNIPSIILERRMEFNKFIIPQIVEEVIYNLSVLFFAWRGMGIRSFTYSVFLRSVFGLVVIYIIQPWIPSFGISVKSLKSLLKFGIPYQLNNFLASLKDDGLTIILGSFLGPFGMGILGTAQKASQYPLRFFMDNVIKVTFPAFSRVQDDKNRLSRFLNRSLFFVNSLVFPSLVGLLVFFPEIITIIPRYRKWETAYLPLLFFSINSMIASFTTQFINTLNALGKIKISFKFMLMWTFLSFLFIPFLSFKFNVVGASIGYMLVSLSSFLVFFVIKDYVFLDIIYFLVKPLISSVGMGVFLLLAKNLFRIENVLTFLFFIVLGVVFYSLSLYLLVGKSLIDDVKKTIRSTFHL